MLTIIDIFDYVFRRSEHQTLGQSGERFLYLELQQNGVPRQQIFRNVYIPAFNNDGQENGKTTEIDIVVLSHKGILLFEHKAYSGKIYGDGRRKQWIQYLGSKKTYFMSPVEQNRYHRYCLQQYLKLDIPIYLFVSHSQCGHWRVHNLPQEVHFLNHKGDFRQIYNQLPKVTIPTETFNELQRRFRALSRPTDGTREVHIANFSHKPSIHAILDKSTSGNKKGKSPLGRAQT